MLKQSLIHPQILAALGRAGHGSRVLIADGNYPHSTTRGPNAEVVYLNLAPGLVKATDVLTPLVQTIPIENAVVMAVNREGPYALPNDPPIWQEFHELLKSTDCRGEIQPVERFAFYTEAGKPDVCLVIATAEQRIYANLLLTIGVVRE